MVFLCLAFLGLFGLLEGPVTMFWNALALLIVAAFGAVGGIRSLLSLLRYGRGRKERKGPVRARTAVRVTFEALVLALLLYPPWWPWFDEPLIGLMEECALLVFFAASLRVINDRLGRDLLPKQAIGDS